MLGPYGSLLRRKGATAFVAAGFVGELPVAMVSLGIVFLVSAKTDSYALAGAMSATFSLSMALVSPLGARFVDRLGQARVLPVMAAGEVLFLLGFVFVATHRGPVALQFLLLIVSGGMTQNMGACVRARWSAMLTGTDEIRPAFSLEAVIDELVFMLGPLAVTWLCVYIADQTGLIAAAALVVLGSGWLASQRSTQPPPRPKRQQHGNAKLLVRTMIIVTVLMALLGAIFGSFEVTTVAFSESEGAEALTGWMLALYAGGSLIAGLVVGAVRVTANPARLLLVYALALAIVTAFYPFVTSLAMLAPVAFLAGMAVSPVLITATTLVENAVPAARLTEALTLTVSAMAVGLAIGSTTSGAIIDAFVPARGYIVMSVGAVLVFAVTAATFRGLARDVVVMDEAAID
ncbi:MAG: hypothetical protein U0990_08965 [Candidatus Nanopelagicales bacterium]|nr:hypothetical protein [Candidatus Nanopelagicales bacterium]MDZ4250204.1 hypothetical protein [Candidatus Nanopelagicales bacterium]